MNAKMIELAKRFKDLKAESAKQEEVLKKINKEWDAVDQELMSLMIDEGVNSASLTGIGRITMRTKNYLSVTKENKEKFFDYLRESGNDSILKLDVHAGTLGTFLDSHLAELKAKNEADGMDMIEARDKALEFLKEKGANYFIKRDLALGKE